MTCFETVHASICISTALSLSDCDKEASALSENSRGSFNLEAVEKKKMKSRHLEMRNILSFLDDNFSMSISLLKEKLLLAVNPKLIWFWRAFGGEKISLRDLMRGALQHFMECKVLQQFGEDGILQREDTMIM